MAYMLGIIAFLAAFIFKERKMQVCALLLIMVSAAAGLTTLKEGWQSGTRDKQVLVATPGQVAEQHKTRKDAQWAYLSVATQRQAVKARASTQRNYQRQP